MGRGLSELQKTMLTMPVDEHGQIYVKDVITKYYGWKQGPNGHFNKTEIGPNAYMSAYMAIRKSVKRLEDRGLIWCIGRSKYDLTHDGRELLVKLNTRAVKPFDLTPEENAVLDRVASEPTPEGIEVSTKSSGTSCCGIWDMFYECPDCELKFEQFGSTRPPVICPQCQSRKLRKC